MKREGRKGGGKGGYGATLNFYVRWLFDSVISYYEWGVWNLGLGFQSVMWGLRQKSRFSLLDFWGVNKVESCFFSRLLW